MVVGPTTAGTETTGEYQGTCTFRVTVLSASFNVRGASMDTGDSNPQRGDEWT
jgi:hypothetical protein